MIANKPQAVEDKKRQQAEKLGYRVELTTVAIDDAQRITRKYALIAPEGEVIASNFDSIEAAFEALPADLFAQQVQVLKVRFEAEIVAMERRFNDERAALAKRFDEALAQVAGQFEEGARG